MSTETLLNANQFAVPDRVGQLVINRFKWPVTAKSDGDKVIVGYLPANCRIHAPDTQCIADGSTGAMTFDLCVDVDAQKITSAQAITANTFNRTASLNTAGNETIGRSTGNRAVYLNLTTAPTVAGGNIYVDLACYDPGL